MCNQPNPSPYSPPFPLHHSYSIPLFLWRGSDSETFCGECVWLFTMCNVVTFRLWYSKLGDYSILLISLVVRRVILWTLDYFRQQYEWISRAVLVPYHHNMACNQFLFNPFRIRFWTLFGLITPIRSRPLPPNYFQFITHQSSYRSTVSSLDDWFPDFLTWRHSVVFHQTVMPTVLLIHYNPLRSYSYYSSRSTN
jgi:hypothetical protein